MSWWHRDVSDPPSKDAPPPLLVQGCEAKAEVRVALMEMERFYNGRLRELSEDFVSLELSDSAAVHVAKWPLVAVSFELDKQGGVFQSKIKDFTPASKKAPARLTLYMPEEVTSVPLRRRQRIPVVETCALEVQLKWKGSERISARPVDLTRDGMRVAFEPEVVLPAEDTLEVQLRLDRLKVQVPALSKQRIDSEMGLFFPSTMRDGLQTVDTTLGELVSEVERCWLQQRAELEQDGKGSS